MPLSKEQSLSQYGTESYTAWGEAEAAADWAAKGSPTPGGGGGVGSAGSAAGPDISGVPSVQDFVQNQFAGEDVAFQGLIDKMAGQEKPLDIFTRLEQEAGLPALRGAAGTLTKEIGNLEDVLSGLPGQIAGTTRESLVTESQRKGLLQAKSEPFLEKLGKFGTALGRISGRIGEAERGITTKTELALQGQKLELAPLEMKFQVLQERNQRTLTGFSLDRESQLEALYAKWNRSNQLSDMEWQVAQEIAGEKRAYETGLKTTGAQLGVVFSGGETPEQMLEMIGNEAARQNRVQESLAGRGTAGERGQVAARERLGQDVNNYSRFDDLVVTYKDELPLSEIRSIYNSGPMAKLYGPASESPERVSELQSGNFDTSSSGKVDETYYNYLVSQGYSKTAAKYLATQ